MPAKLCVSLNIQSDTLLTGLYTPQSWSTTAGTIAAFSKTITTTPVPTNGTASPSSNTTAPPESSWIQNAVWCGDAQDATYPTTKVFSEIVNTSLVISQMFDSEFQYPGFFCHKSVPFIQITPIVTLTIIMHHLDGLFVLLSASLPRGIRLPSLLGLS